MALKRLQKRNGQTDIKATPLNHHKEEAIKNNVFLLSDVTNIIKLLIRQNPDGKSSQKAQYLKKFPCIILSNFIIKINI